MHPNRYKNDTRVGLARSLLTSITLPLFVPWLETNSPLLDNFDSFTQGIPSKFSGYGCKKYDQQDSKVETRDCPILGYTTNFLLHTFDIPWNEEALMNQFCHEVHNDVNDLFLTFLEDPKSLIEAINWVVRCDNRLLERFCEKQPTLHLETEKTYGFM